eukprot:9480867-Heterocapsa_arctica.AAC.1
MEVIREMAAARSLPDGRDGPTLRQVLEVVAGAVGVLTNGQVEMFMGSFGLWMATQGGATRRLSMTRYAHAGSGASRR